MTDTVRVPRAWLEAFRRDTDPTEPIADNGGTVWDMFCHEAIAMLAASPQGEESPPAMSADHIGDATNMIAPVEAVAWRYRFVTTTDGKSWSDWYYADAPEDIPTRPEQVVQPLYTHTAPIKPSADTGELRERVARIVDPISWEALDVYGQDKAAFIGLTNDGSLTKADAILDLIQSERAG